MLSFISIIGGIGFFLLGMNIITDGLKAMAGDTLRKWLDRFTGGTFSAISTGTIITLLVQSSTATTLMTIGFVSAGMLTFAQAVGVIFGANLGTTSIGWFVSIIGLKFSISEFALPLIGIGMLFRQFSKGKLANLGIVFAGFGLLFVGIQFLQDGMSVASDSIDLSRYAGDSIGGMLILVMIGIVMTIIMQSSGAAVATTMTVMASGVIDLDQAVVLIIGQNIGTTATAAIAAIGASIPAKRTAISHILFNIGTGIVTLLIFPFIMIGLNSLSVWMNTNDPTILLAIFHTFFSLFGILLFAPFVKQFVRLIAWILPEKKSPITQFIDHHIIQIPSIAIETAIRAIHEAAKLTLFEMTKKLTELSKSNPNQQVIESCDEKLTMIQEEIEAIHQFVEDIRETSPKITGQYISILHALDHIERMNRLTVNVSTEKLLTNSANEIYPIVSELLEHIEYSIQAIEKSNLKDAVPILSQFSQEFAEFRKQERENVFDVTAKGDVSVTNAFRYVQLILFIDGLAYHLWRAVHHMDKCEQSKKNSGKSSKKQEASPEKDREM